MPELQTLIPIIIPALIGLILGFIIGKLTKTKNKSSVLTSSSDEMKLANEVLRDQVKQLEAKIKTLERAIEITSKN